MKKLISVIVIVVAIIVLIAVGNGTGENELLRIHIRANSNDVIDQSIKYKIKDEMVEYLTPYLSNVNSKAEAEAVIKSKINEINNLVDRMLQRNGFDYKCNAKICNEYFPTRVYEDITVQSGYYDALILELGEAQGDNWWCVVYPPLCFVNTKYINSEGVVYKSKILEIIRSWLEK